MSVMDFCIHCHRYHVEGDSCATLAPIEQFQARLPAPCANPVVKRWADYKWPDWIPEQVRRSLMDFWNERWGRGPHEWHRNNTAEYNGHPPLGAFVECESISKNGLPLQRGRWIPMWNNIGRVLREDGTIGLSSTCGIRILENERIVP